jgi:hypothetical protein
MNILRDLPETDQESVLQYLKQLKARQTAGPTTAPPQMNPALHNINGLLVFTGELLGDPKTWLKLSREEREQDILGRAGQNADQ